MSTQITDDQRVAVDTAKLGALNGILGAIERAYVAGAQASDEGRAAIQIDKFPFAIPDIGPVAERCGVGDSFCVEVPKGFESGQKLEIITQMLKNQLRSRLSGDFKDKFFIETFDDSQAPVLRFWRVAA